MANLAAYVGAERPAILEATGHQPDDPIALDQLWKKFAQMVVNGAAIDGKTIELITEFPTEGNEDILYILTNEIPADINPITPTYFRGLYSFDGSSFHLELDLTDFTNQILDLEARVENTVVGTVTNNLTTATIVNYGDKITLTVGSLSLTMTNTQISIGDSFVYDDTTKELMIAGYKVITEADAASSTDVTNAWNGGD